MKILADFNHNSPYGKLLVIPTLPPQNLGISKTHSYAMLVVLALALLISSNSYYFPLFLFLFVLMLRSSAVMFVI
jgi:hypothetical protein